MTIEMTTGTTTDRDDVERRTPLLFNQEFLGAFDQGDDAGPFGPRYHVVHGWRLAGALDLDALQGALDDVVARHEALRTTLVRGEASHQVVHAPAAVPITVVDLTACGAAERDAEVEQLLCDVEAGTIAAASVPQLRAVVGRFDESDAVLVLMAHHTSTDGYSMRIVARDVVNRYARHTGHAQPPLPAPGQAGDHAIAERASAAAGDHAAAAAFWRAQLDGGAIHTWPTDHARSAGRTPTTTGMHRFAIDATAVSPVLELSRAGRGSPFMALLAAYAVFVRRVQDETDISVPTFSPGRRPGFEEAVGSFFNFMPVRCDLAGAGTYREVFARVRRSCLLSYGNDMPGILGESPAIMARGMGDQAATCVFQVFPYPHLLDGTRVGDLTWTEVRMRLRDQDLCTDIPDGILWTLNLDGDGTVIGHVAFKHHLYERETIRAWVAEFCRVLTAVAADPDADITAI